MSNKYTNLNDLFTAIADAIRRKTDSITAIKADDFAVEIDNVEMGLEYTNEHITAIPDYMFYNCDQLKSIDCPNVETIGISAFENCIRLKEATISPTTQQIGANAFKGCLNTVIYADMTEIPEGWDEQWNPDNCPILGSQVAQWDISATTDDSVTATLYNNILMAETYILKLTGQGAMISYSSDLTQIPWHTYKDKIGRITIDNGITFISEAAFANCTMVESIALPNTVADLGIGVFEGCTNLSQIEVSTQMLRIPERTFKNCASLNNVVLPDSMTHFEYNSFQGCTSLDTIHLPAKLESIGSYVFEGCSAFTEFVIPSTVTGLGRWTFANCTGLTHMEIPETVTGIKENLFDGCTGLKTAIIPKTIRTLSATFNNCINLEEVSLPGNLTSLGSNAFKNCTKLSKIYYDGPDYGWSLAVNFYPSWNDNTGEYIVYCTQNRTLNKNQYIATMYSNSEVFAYMESIIDKPGYYNIRLSGTGIAETNYYNKGPWKQYLNKIVSVIVEEGITSIGVELFKGATIMETINLPNTLTEIRTKALYSLSALSVINYNGTRIQWGAINKADVWISSNKDYIIKCHDGDLPKQTYLIIAPDKPLNISATINDNVIATLITDTEDTSVYHLSIAGNGNMIPKFYYDRIIAPWYKYTAQISTIAISEGVTSISAYAFKDCENITAVVLPNGITTIGKQAFYNCTNLLSITLPATIQTINTQTLSNCPKLTTINYLDTITQWQKINLDLDIDNDIEYTVYCTDGTITKSGVITYYPTEE